MTSDAYEELDYGMTPLGELILRRRKVLSLGGIDVFEVILDNQFLMSSLVNDAEIALATLALPLVASLEECHVMVGGLGLGCTANAALDAENVHSVTVVEYLERVIDWHRRGLVPLHRRLKTDPRCKLHHGDFFEVVGDEITNGDACTDSKVPIGQRRFNAILLDIDHSPRSLLHANHAAFYSEQGLRRLATHLHPRGVFALWSADTLDKSFVDALESVFPSVEIHETSFENPLLDRGDHNFIVVAQID